MVRGAFPNSEHNKTQKLPLSPPKKSHISPERKEATPCNDDDGDANEDEDDFEKEGIENEWGDPPGQGWQAKLVSGKTDDRENCT